MTSAEGITTELSLGEVISRTFDLFRRDFVKYFLIFVIAEIVVGVATLLVYSVVQLPTVPTNPTDLSWLPGYLTASLELYAVIGVTNLIVVPIAEGAAIRIAADAVEGRQAVLGASVRFALSRLVSMWVVSLVVGVIVVAGFVALVVPGVILAIMFCLVLPALLLENTRVLGSLSRSRELVSHRWGKTFATFVVLGLIVVVIGTILGVVGGFFRGAAPAITDVLSAFYQPLFPIALTVYFFSNRARINPSPQMTQAPMGYGPAPRPGLEFCSNCGTQLVVSATYCSNCGAKQPEQP